MLFSAQRTHRQNLPFLVHTLERSMEETLKVQWEDGFVFSSQTPSGFNFVMDSHPETGGQGKGPTPFEAMVASTAACSAIDVMIVLNKMKQEVESYHIEVSYERSAPQGAYPRPITGMIVHHVVKGPKVDPAAVEKAVKLSDEKYCSVIATHRTEVEVKSTWEIQ